MDQNPKQIKPNPNPNPAKIKSRSKAESKSNQKQSQNPKLIKSLQKSQRILWKSYENSNPRTSQDFLRRSTGQRASFPASREKANGLASPLAPWGELSARTERPLGGPSGARLAQDLRRKSQDLLEILLLTGSSQDLLFFYYRFPNISQDLYQDSIRILIRF